MIGVVINNTVYPAMSARALLDTCREHGIDTSWWEDIANTIEMHSGDKPTEAHLLLPYSTIQILNAVEANDTVGLDEAGQVVEGSEGRNVYDRIIRVFQMISRNPDWDGEDPNTKYSIQEQDFEGMIFVGSRAIDPQLDTKSDLTVHLARFVDLRGLDELVSGPRSSNRNLVYGLDFDADVFYDPNSPPIRDPWGFYFVTDYSSWEEQPWAWVPVASALWADVVRDVPNAKHSVSYGSEPTGYEFPYFPPSGEPVYGKQYWGNMIPHNLVFKDMTPWQAYCSFLRKISHEIYPRFDGTFWVQPIHYHTMEDDNWIEGGSSSYNPDDDTYRSQKLQYGEALYDRLNYVIDQDHPPRLAVVPHSFVAIFSKTLGVAHESDTVPGGAWNTTHEPIDLAAQLLDWNSENRPVESVVTWRGSGEGSIFTNALTRDTDFFDTRFLTDHPYLIAGTPNNGADEDIYSTAPRSLYQHVDCTFYAVPQASGESETLDMTHTSNGLGTAIDEFSIPIVDDNIVGNIATLIAKWHLKTLLFGDLGTVSLTGLHDFEPGPRYQTVIFNCGVNGPTTTLHGEYREREIFPREVTTRQLTFEGSFTGLAVVVQSLVPPDYTTLTGLDPVGASDDFSGFQQPYTTGLALPLRWDNDNGWLVPNVPEGATTSDYYVEFRVVRNDTLIAPGTLIFIKSKIGHTISACDYLRYVNVGTVNTATDKVLCKAGSDGTIFWGDAGDFVGPEGPPGGGGGGGTVNTVTEGYAIDVTGTATDRVVAFDPTEITNMVFGPGGQFQFFAHDPDASLSTHPKWWTVNDYSNSLDQMWWKRGTTFEFKTTTDYAGSTSAPQLLVNWGAANGGNWQWVSLENCSHTVGDYQFIINRDDDWQWATAASFHSGTKQLLTHDHGDLEWKYDGYTEYALKIPTSIELAVIDSGTKIQVKLNYTNYYFIGKPVGTTGEMHATLDATSC